MEVGAWRPAERPACRVPIIVVIVVVMMVVPLPATVLDILIASNLAMSLLVLLVAMQVRKPLGFWCPPLVLVGTIFRLALNVSSTRLVLRDGFAGNVIEAFGHIVIGGSLVIGLWCSRFWSSSS